MPAYIAANFGDLAVTPSFNEAAAILKSHKDVKIRHALPGRHPEDGYLGVFSFEAPARTVKVLEKEMPGWIIDRAGGVELQ